jgi:hypothetical protein
MGSTTRDETVKPRPSRKDYKQTLLPTKFSPRFWSDCDARLSVVRCILSRYKTVREACGGEESVQRDILAQRIAFFSIYIETTEIALSKGEPVDFGSYVQCVNTLIGLIRIVGLDKRIKTATDLQSYIHEKERRAA